MEFVRRDILPKGSLTYVAETWVDQKTQFNRVAARVPSRAYAYPLADKASSRTTTSIFYSGLIEAKCGDDLMIALGFYESQLN